MDQPSQTHQEWLERQRPPVRFLSPRLSTVRVCQLALLFLAAAITGCGEGSGEPVRPGAATVSDSMLIDVLADLHIADAKRYLYNRDSLAAGGVEPDAAVVDSVLRARGSAMDSVLASHGVGRRAYDEALDWYVDHPDQFVNLYNRVLDRLNQGS